VRALFTPAVLFDGWAAEWRQRLARDPQPPAQRATGMRAVNPAFIPRNHRVEQAIEAAVRDADLQPFRTLVAVLERPFDDQPGQEDYTRPALPSERVCRTFCGT